MKYFFQNKHKIWYTSSTCCTTNKKTVLFFVGGKTQDISLKIMATFGSENRGTTRCGNHEGLLSAQGWWHTSLLGRRCLGWWGRGRVGPVAQRATACSQWLCVCCSIGRWCCRDLGWSTTRWLGKGDSGSSEGWATEYDWTLLLRMGVFCWKGLPWKFHKFTCNSFNCIIKANFMIFR